MEDDDYFMKLTDHFAGAALTALIARSDADYEPNQIACLAYETAEAMINERIERYPEGRK